MPSDLEKLPIADFHVHLSLKPANNESIPTIWSYRSNPKPNKFLFFFNLLRLLGLNKFYKDYATYTQFNLESCVKGNVRLILCSLYPIERQYVNRKRLPTFLISTLTLFTKTAPWFRIIHKKRVFLTSLLRVIVGVSNKRALELWFEQKKRSNYIDYFKDYINESRYLTNEELLEPPSTDYKDYSFKIATNYDELKQYIENEKIICGIVSLEGLHGLGRYKVKHLFSKKTIEDLNSSNRKELEKSFIQNITSIKSDKKLTPFYITFAHHYNNLICGHCTSFSGSMTWFFNQKGGLNKDITDFGKRLITDHLLTRSNGKRILIDIKHMSVASRVSYYDLIESSYVDDKVPIISSHSAINGIKDIEVAKKQKASKKLDRNSYVSQWNVNLTDYDILKIYKSDGLIGILMHDGRMPGKLFKNALESAQNSYEKNLLHIQMFLTNIYHLIYVVFRTLNESAWHIVSLGSDMDGIIDPFDNYDSAARLKAFREDILDYLEQYDLIDDQFKIKNIYDEDKDIFTKDEIETINQGNEFKEIVAMIFFNNVNDFLSKYFTDEYLLNEDII